MSGTASDSELARRSGLRLSNQEANQLTRECIEAALLILMEDRELNTISITDIIQRAGVSRSAYYRNYSSKEDILTNVFNEAAKAIVSALSESIAQQNMHDCYTLLFQQVWQVRRLFEIIRKAKMVDQFQTAVNERYLADVPDSDVLEYYRIRSWIGSIFNIIFGWINRGYSESIDTMAEVCQTFLSEEDMSFGTGRKWE